MIVPTLLASIAARALAVLLVLVMPGFILRYGFSSTRLGAENAVVWLHVAVLALGMPVALTSALAMRLDVIHRLLPARAGIPIPSPCRSPQPALWLFAGDWRYLWRERPIGGGFGVLIVVNLIIGGLTAPFGVLVFVVSGVTNTPTTAILRTVVPYVLAPSTALAAICPYAYFGASRWESIPCLCCPFPAAHCAHRIGQRAWCCGRTSLSSARAIS